MIPGELFTDDSQLELNPGRRTLSLVVENASDRPIQVGSHYHFAETNAGLRFDRMFLHARQLDFDHPASAERITVLAPLPPACTALLGRLAQPH